MIVFVAVCGACGVYRDRVFFTVCLGDRQLADSEETFDICDKKCFGPTSLREPLRLLYMA